MEHPRHVSDLPTPAVVIDLDALDANLATMASLSPGSQLRPHVKAHKCSALAARQVRLGHPGLTCATPREVIGLRRAGVDADLLLANEVVDVHRLTAMVDAAPDVTVAVDSEATIDAAARAGVRRCVIDVAVGMPRCGVAPDRAGALADEARRRGLEVRGVMGYEGHLMMVADRTEQAQRVEAAMELLAAAARDVGGSDPVEVVSAGGTGTALVHADQMQGGSSTGVTEVQAGSYALMDTHYARLDLPFRQALWVLGTVISVSPGHAVADVGLKALGMDHGNPTVEGARVWFCSDEHITFAPDRAAPDQAAPDQAAPGEAHGGTTVSVGQRIRVTPAHVDPTMAMHDTAWVVSGDEVVDRWAIDLRGW